MLSEVAAFYVDLIERCHCGADGILRIGPSFSPEHGPFGTDNTPVDLAYIRNTFEWTIQAAASLGIGGELAAQCSALLDRLPPYPVALDADGQEIVVDWQGCAMTTFRNTMWSRQPSRFSRPKRVHWFSPEGEKALFARTLAALRHNGNNAHVMTNVARARLSLPSAIEETRRWFSSVAQPNGMFYWQGHGYYLSESSAVAGLVSEFLTAERGGHTAGLSSLAGGRGGPLRRAAGPGRIPRLGGAGRRTRYSARRSLDCGRSTAAAESLAGHRGAPPGRSRHTVGSRRARHRDAGNRRP